MSHGTSDAIRVMTLDARKLLIEEIGQQLEGVYGWLPDGELRAHEHYPVLTSVPEADDTRRRLETWMAEEGQAGLDAPQAREKLVKEAAFTWLNRFVAFKMMEARKLLRQAVSKGQESNGFKMWLTDPGNEEHLKDYERGDFPEDAFGEGPRHRAYRRFLLAQCAKLALEIRVLFDPENLPSRLCPRPQALRALIDLLGEGTLAEAWEPRTSRQQRRFSHRDGLVQCLVENTLGRMWVQMHPDSRLGDQLEYLVPACELSSRSGGETRERDPCPRSCLRHDAFRSRSFRSVGQDVQGRGRECGTSWLAR